MDYRGPDELLEPEPFPVPGEEQPVADYEPDERYFATLEGEELGAELCERVDRYYERLHMRGLPDVWYRSYRSYYGLSEEGGASQGASTGYHQSSTIAHDGRQGELTMVKINHYRSLARGLLTLTTKSRPHFQARATNTDHKSLEQTHVAQGVLEYYLREQRLESLLKGAVERAIVFGEGFVVPTWDATAGDRPQGQGQPVGDIDVELFTPLDVVRDWRRPPDKTDWYILRAFVNKYDLMAQYPEFGAQLEAHAIESAPPLYEFGRRWEDDSDDIPLYTFYHRRTDAVPDGRYALFVSPEALLDSGALPYDDVPVYRMAPGDFIGSAFGYSDAWDLLGIQQVIDAMVSVVVSNYDAFALQNVAVDDGYELESDQLNGALRVWKIPQGGMMPQGVQLTRMPDGILEFISQCVGWMETLSGVNSVARGNVEQMGSGTSGAAFAMIHSMAQEYNSGLQAGYAHLIEDMGTGLLNILKTYAQEPRMVAIAGVDQSYATTMFTGDQIERVERVVVDSGNPMLRSAQGRWQFAEMLMRMQAEMGIKVIDSPEQIIQVLTTGQLQSMTTGPAKHLSGIKLENEKLAQGPRTVEVQVPMGPAPVDDLGRPLGPPPTINVPQTPDVPVIRYDDHLLHIAEHMQVLYSPDSRLDPNVTAAVCAHCEWHEFEMLRERQRKQGLEMMFGGGAPPPGAPEEPPPGEPPPTPKGPPDVEQKAEQVSEPKLPTNPMTGEPAQVGA